MNCTNCHAPLAENARFCAVCGTPVQPAQNAFPDRTDDPTVQIQPSRLPLMPTVPIARDSHNAPPGPPPVSPVRPPDPLPYYQAQKSATGANMLSATGTQSVNTARRARRVGGCAI